MHCLLHPHSSTEAGEMCTEAAFGFATFYVPALVWHAESWSEALSVRAATWSRRENTALCRHPHYRWPHLGKSSSFPILSKGELVSIAGVWGVVHPMQDNNLCSDKLTWTWIHFNPVHCNGVWALYRYTKLGARIPDSLNHLQICIWE